MPEEEKNLDPASAPASDPAPAEAPPSINSPQQDSGQAGQATPTEVTPVPEPVQPTKAVQPDEPIKTVEEPINPAPVLEPLPVFSPAPSAGGAAPPLTNPEPFANGGASSGVSSPIKDLLVKARAKIQWRKQRKLEKVMALAREKGRIANQDVEKLLRVSDATATRYLAALVQAGRLKRVFHPRHARYEPVN